ncbi:MAG TPA: hypothetical protein VIK38_08565 [Coriobacteriia bacterium]
MDLSPVVGRDEPKHWGFRAAGRLLGVAFALTGLAACAASPGASAPLPTFPVSAEPLPSATSGTAYANLTCGGGRTFPRSGLDAPTGAENASGPEFDALRASLAKFGSEFPGSAAWTWRLAGRDATDAIFLAWTNSTGQPGWVSIEVVSGADGWQPSGMGQCEPLVVLSADFGPATWALDPAFPAPGPASTELHILVWGTTCSSGLPTTGRISAPDIEYAPDVVTITIGVRPLSGVQTCQGVPGTPATVRLAEPLGTRTLLDGGRVPAAPPSPASLPAPTPSAPALVLPAGAPPTTWSRVADAPLLHVSPASNTAVATAPDGRFVAIASAIDSRKAPVVLHSVDGVTWTAGGSLPASGDTQVSAIARWGDLLVAVGEDTTALWAAMAKGEATDARPADAAWTSTDGTTWQRVPDQPAFAPGELLRVTAGPAGLMAVRGLGFGSLVFSRDGTTWSEAPVGTPGANVSDVSATDEGFVAVGSVETSAAAWMSPDGQHWQRATFPDGSDASADLVSVAAQGCRLVALGAVPAPGDEAIPGAWTGPASWLSADGGASWTQTGSALHGTAPDLYPSIPDLYAMSGGFIVVGDNAQGNLAVWTSVDGTKWQPATIDATSEEFGRSLAVSGSRAIIGGKTVGTGMGGDRAVFWTGDVGSGR